MDFKGFKFVGSKNDRATFKHKKGHYISVAMKGLSKEHKQAIEELAGGGMVKGVNKEVPTEKGVSKAGLSYRSSKDSSNEYKKEDLHAAKVQHRITLQELKKQPEPKLMAEGGDAMDRFADSTNQGQVDDAKTHGGMDLSDDPADLNKNSVSSSKPIPLQGNPSGLDRATQLLQGQSPPPITAPTDPSTSAPAQSAQGDEFEKQFTKAMTPATSIAPSSNAPGQDYPSVSHFLGDEAAKTERDISNGKISPKTYENFFSNRSTLGKVGALAGLFFSGFASGLTGQPDVAISAMDKIIKNDLEAQQKSSENATNLFRINQQNPLVAAQAAKFGIDTKTMAQSLAYQQQWQISFNKIAQTVAKEPPGPQKDQHLQMLAALYQNGKDKLADNIAGMQALSGVVQPPQQQQQDSSSTEPTPLLKPGASIQGTQYNPVLDKDRQGLVDQFTGAQQTDKSLAALKPAFEKMQRYANETGRAAQVLGGLPYHIGDAVRALGALDPDTRAYQSARTTLVESLVSSGKYTQDQAKEVIDNNAFVKGDSKELAQQKLSNIASALKRSTKTSLLDTYGLTKTQKP